MRVLSNFYSFQLLYDEYPVIHHIKLEQKPPRTRYTVRKLNGFTVSNVPIQIMLKRLKMIKDVNIIVAAAENGVIGRNGNLPWNLPADKKYLKRSIGGNIVIHGTRVFEELGEKVRSRIFLRSIVEYANITHTY